MTKVYLALTAAPDELLGRVDENGKIYRSQFGPDDQIGHVDLATGAIYEQRFGPDKQVGRVDLSNGKVYISRLGPDDHVGWVKTDGKMHRHVALAADDYVGKIEPFSGYAHAAAAMLLLVLPVLDERAGEETGDSGEEDGA